MKLIIKNARLSFNDLFEPKVLEGKSKFSATLLCSADTKIQYTDSKGEKRLVPHDQVNGLVDHILKEKFGKIPPKTKNWAYNKADGSTTREEYIDKDGNYYAGVDKDTWFFTASKLEGKCKNGKMTVLDQRREPIEASSGLLHSGCYVNAVIDIYAYDADKAGKGVSASLEGVQLLRKGEALGFTPVDATNDFEDEEIEAEDDADSMM